MKDALEFLAKFDYDDNKSNNSYSFQSIISLNIVRKVMSLNESTIGTELFLKLMCKNWKDKFNKIDHCIDKSNTKNLRRQTKLFKKLEFITSYALLIGACYYCHLGSALFNIPKENK